MANSLTARVKIGNTSPTGVGDGPYTAFLNQPLIVSAAEGVLANDTDAEGDPLQTILVTPPTNGTLILKPNGAFTYIANSNYTGLDSFSYKATDAFATSVVARVSLDVRRLLAVVAVTPVPGSVAIAGNSSFSIEFNHTLSESSLGTNLALLGSFTGPRTFSHSLSGNTLHLNPAEPFLAGEQITVLVSDGVRGAGGEALLHGFEAQFIAEAPAGNGTFSDSGQLIGDTNYNSQNIVLGDLNGDGSLDAIIPNAIAINAGIVIPGAAHVWTNNGSGVFIDTGRILGTNNSAAAVLGDLNGDGSLDVVYRSSQGIEIWLNDGSARFTRSAQNFGTNAISSLALADMDGDGALDLIALGAVELRIFLNDGAGHFTENPASVASLSFNNQNFVKVFAADLNGDGAVDLLLQDFFTTRSERVLLNDGHGILSDTGQRFSGASASALGDFNGDGFPDLFLPGAGGAYIWLNDGTGFFKSTEKIYTNLFVKNVELADVNGDGTLDAIVVQYNGDSFPLTNFSTILLNDGTGNFTDSSMRFDDLGFTSSGSANIPTSLAVGDVNGDGAPDIFVAGGFRLPNQVWLNHATLPAPLGAQALTINDTQTAQPFGHLALRGTVTSVKVGLDQTAKGVFTPTSLTSGGFTGPVGGFYSLAAANTATIQAALRQLVYAPARNRVPVGSNEVTTFTVIISDGSSFNTNRSFMVTSVSVNDPPVANNDSGTTFSTTKLAAFTTGNVLANDTDPDPSDTLSVTGLVPGNLLGTVTNLGNGTFRYDPNAKFNSLPVGQTANDSFTYTIQDAHGATAFGLVTIAITGVNQPPVASNVALTLAENSGATVITPLLFANATDPDAGDKAGFSISAINTAGTHGQVQLLAGDVVTYNPYGAFPNLAPGATASDSFGFTLTDGHGGFSSAQANITILGVNDLPVAGLTIVTVLEHSGETNVTAALLDGASDPDPGETATLQLVSIDPSATVGSVTFTNGIVTYSPSGQFQALTEGQTNVDTFNYTIQDPHGATTIGTAEITIIGQNDTPIPAPAFITVDDGSGPVNLTSALLAPVTDADDGESTTLRISALVDTSLSAGRVTFSNGVVMYHPPTLFLSSGQFVTNAFQYAVEDIHGSATSNGVAVIYIVGVNSVPEITCGGASVLECSSNAAAANLSATVRDADGNALEVVWQVNGTIVRTNSLAAAPAPNSNTVVLAASLPLGTNSIVVSVSDGIAPPVFCSNTVAIVDTLAPVITILGANPFTNECHSPFTDPGAKVSDTCAGDLTSGITVSGTVDRNTVGTYILTYSAKDPSGNKAMATRTVSVVDTTKPVIALLGANPQTIECHGAYVELGAKASDNCAGDLTSAIVIDATRVNASAVGSFTVTYNVEDPSHHHADTVTRGVNVMDTTPPVIGPCPADQTVTATSTAGAVAIFATPTATDNCSVNVRCVPVPASGSTFPLGTNIVRCTATDDFTNSVQCLFNVSIVYSWSGFLQSINTDGSSVFKIGSTVPVKFQLSGASAGITNAVAKFSYTKLSATVRGAVNEATSTAAATTGNLFRYDPTFKQYVFNWGTKGLTAATYQLKIDLGDGISRTVKVALK